MKTPEENLIQLLQDDRMKLLVRIDETRIFYLRRIQEFKQEINKEMDSRMEAQANAHTYKMEVDRCKKMIASLEKKLAKVKKT